MGASCRALVTGLGSLGFAWFLLMGYAGPHDPPSRVPLGKSRLSVHRMRVSCTGCVCVLKLGKDTDGVQLRERERCAGSE